MDNENMPPWDINRPIQNPIDQEMIFMQPLDIFSMPNPTQKTNINDSNNNTKKDLNNTSLQTLSQKQDINNTQTPQNTESKGTKSHNDIKEAITLALKYRPKTFAELVGQDSVSRTLCLALDSKKIANAYLFSGLRGSGKTSSARILARSLQCDSGITSNPCGNCPNCIAALKGAHLDIVELDGASNRKIDDIRDLIEQTRYKPTMGRFKVFIIDEVHMLTKEAFNSLLKTLEEPPSYVKFILATTDPLKVPPTILSRTQHFRFKKIPINALKNHLAHILQNENVLADNESLDMIIRNGHGSVRDTLTLLDQAIVFCEGKLTTQKLADMLGALDPKAFDTLFQALLSKNMQACIKFAHSLEGYEIEMILDELSLYIKNKMLEEIPQIPPVLGMRYANIINDSKAMLHLDCDSEFCLLLTILKMLEAQKIREVAHAIKQLEAMQTNLEITQLAKDYLTNTTQNLAQDNSHNAKTLQVENTENKDSIQVLEEANKTQDYIKNNNAKDVKQTQVSTINSKENIIQNTEKDINQTINTKEANIKHPEKQDSISLDSKDADTNIKDSEIKHTNTIQNFTEFTQQESQKNMQTVVQDNNAKLFKSLITKLYDRDYTIGNLFEKKIIFDRFEGTTIYLIFYLTEQELGLLRQGYSGIMQVMKGVYGDSIKMQVEKREPQKLIHDFKKHNASNGETKDSLKNQTQHKQENIKAEVKQDSIITNDSTTKDYAMEIKQETKLESNIENNNTKNTLATQDSNEQALNFISQNRDMVKSMKNELGIKEVKILSLDIL